MKEIYSPELSLIPILREKPIPKFFSLFIIFILPSFSAYSKIMFSHPSVEESLMHII